MKTQSKGGPKTDSGKAVSSLNAIKHGLLSKEVLMEGENSNNLTELKETIEGALSPVGPIEKLLVDRIISNVWRLRRALTVETKTMEWYQNDVDLLPLMNETEEQLARKNITKMVSNNNTENILRYETTIERSLFRALHELERIQAKRNGKDTPVPSMVDISLDSSFGKNDL